MDLDSEITAKNESYQKLVEELTQLNQKRAEIVNQALELLRKKDRNHASELDRINQRRQEIANGLLRLEGAIKTLQDLKQKEKGAE